MLKKLPVSQHRKRYLMSHDRHNNMRYITVYRGWRSMITSGCSGSLCCSLEYILNGGVVYIERVDCARKATSHAKISFLCFCVEPVS